MPNRNPLVVFILSLITCGIYHVYWWVATKIELKERGADIPTAWLIIVPFANIYWLWKWSEGVQKITGFTAAGAFVLAWFTGPVGAAIIQNAMNKAGSIPRT